MGTALSNSEVDGQPANSAHEAARLADLAGFDIIDSLPEQAYDDIAGLAGSICEAPVALVTFVDQSRQWFKAKVGTDLTENERDKSFCTHALDKPDELMIVEDASNDPRFANNELVTGDFHIRFYAGVPLTTKRGTAIGTLCVFDTEPRSLSDVQAKALEALARKVMAELELRRTLKELESAYAQLAGQNITDGLTGLANRREFDIRLEEEIERCRRSGRPLSLALLDVDNFKEYNDTYGHQAGDDALRQVAKLLGDVNRSADLVARYGGEEFVVIMPDTPREGAAAVVERLRQRVETDTTGKRQITVSIGLTTVNAASADADTIVPTADQALYRAKELGRNRCETA